MNWDTNELLEWITGDEKYWNVLVPTIENELSFMEVLTIIINNINIFRVNCDERRIDSSKVNGNEIYVSFCELNGIETEGWK